MRCWGRNAEGQLGTGSAGDGSPVPAPVLEAGGGGLLGVESVGLGDQFSCARMVDGTARCWGSNSSGQLGTGTVGGQQVVAATPVVDELGTALAGVDRVSLGKSYACARMVDGTARCWGSNQFGQLGTGAPGLDSPKAVPVLDAEGDVLQGVRQVAAGGSNACAVLEDGSAVCWGYFVSGPGPTPVADEFGVPLLGVEQIEFGTNHACVRLVDTSVRCFGDNYQGQLGNPEPPPGLLWSLPVLDEAGVGLQGATAIVAGAQHTCARLVDGSTVCWGSDNFGQRGRGVSDIVTATPERPVGADGVPLAGGRQLSSGPYHICSNHGDDTLRCWGSDYAGQSGNDAQALVSPRPVVVRDAQGQPFLARGVGAGGDHTCAFDAGGKAHCWGNNFAFQLGSTATPPATLRPGPVAGVTAFDLSLSFDHSCARSFDSVACWGHGTPQPTFVNSDEQGFPIGGVTQIGATLTGGCAIAFGGEVWCWQAGPNTIAFPVHVEGNVRLTDAQSLASASSDFTYRVCAVLGDGTARCWGFDQDVAALLRDGQGEVVTGLSELAVSPSHTCGRFDDGKLRCWGSNAGGECGLGFEQASVASPTPVRDENGAEIVGALDVVAGEGSTCALLADGTPRCWGDNFYGQTGNGRYFDVPHFEPAPVIGLGEGLRGAGPGGG